jgi:hypothetical protein
VFWNSNGCKWLEFCPEAKAARGPFRIIRGGAERIASPAMPPNAEVNSER